MCFEWLNCLLEFYDPLGSFMLLRCKSAEFMLLVSCKLVWCWFIPLSLYTPPCQLALTPRDDGEMFHWSYFWRCYIISLSVCLLSWSGVMLRSWQARQCWSSNCGGSLRYLRSCRSVGHKNIRKLLALWETATVTLWGLSHQQRQKDHLGSWKSSQWASRPCEPEISCWLVEMSYIYLSASVVIFCINLNHGDGIS